MSLSPYSKIRLSRMGQYDEPVRLSQATRKGILRKLMAKQVTYDEHGKVIEPVSPGFEEDNVKFFPRNISFSGGEKSLLNSPGQFDNMNLNETDWHSRSYSPIPFCLDDDQSVHSSPLQEFNFRSPVMSPVIHHSTPVKDDIPPYMESKSVQLSPMFVARNDYCKENHWKILAFEYLIVELFSILQSYGVDLDPRINYSPTVLIERLWELLSKMVQEKLRIENEALNNTSIRDVGGKIENLNRSVLSQLYETEKQLLRQRRINAKDRSKAIKYKTRLQTAMANFAFPDVQRDLEKKALAQLEASQQVVALLNTELRLKREKNAQLEEKVIDLCNRVAEVQAGCAQELTEAAQLSAIGEEVIESAITSYMEKATQFSPQALSPSEWHEIASEAVKHLKFNFDLNEHTIRKLENEIIIQNRTLNDMEAERLKLKERIFELDVTLRQQKQMIRMYEEELEPAGREIREWIEYAARKDGPPVDPAWSPMVPNPYDSFAPEGFSSPLPADKAFRELPLRRRRIFVRSPEPVYVSPRRSPMQHINKVRLMASPPPPSPARVASPQYATAPVQMASPQYVSVSPVRMASPQYASDAPVLLASPQVVGSPVAVAQLSPAYSTSLLEDASLPSGLSGLSDSPGAISAAPTRMPIFSPIRDIHPDDVNMSGIPSIFSPLGSESPDFRASTPVYGGSVVPAYGNGGLFRSNMADFLNHGLVNQSVLLHSPYRTAPVQLDVSVQPQPLQQTQSGEHVVCDISLNMEDLAAKR